MPLEPRLRPLLAIANRSDDDGATLPARRLTSTLQARQLGRLVMPHGPKVPTREVMVPVHGGAIRVRLYESIGPGPKPLHVFLHGGGWCVGDLDQRDPRCRAIAQGAACTVASVDYRMAPENAYPVPLEDCYAALTWLVDHAEELGLDPERVSVGGESAGANLAAVVAILARDRNGPPLVLQWLDVPATDLTLSQPSVDRLGTGYGLTKAGMEEYVAAYLRDVDPVDGYVSPLHCADLSGLPSTLLMTAEYDPLQDDGTAYADRLREAGVAVEQHHLPGLVHASFAFTRLLPTAKTYEQSAIATLRRAYAPQS
ncbi:MAG: alpha/beta hydrolase [Acidimicrobiales bacterium]